MNKFVKSELSRLICISGSSGVGKTTIAGLISKMLGDRETLIISGDDLHLYERSSDVWKEKTHLNPSCNDLETGYFHLMKLIEGKRISRKKYNHTTGIFDPVVDIDPASNVVYEGLHALYDERVNKIAQCKIFVETSESLKNEWKLRRDTKKRGYTEAQVLDILSRRKIDEEKYIVGQRHNADIIVIFEKRHDQTIDMQVVCVNESMREFSEQLKEFYDSVQQFCNICVKLSLDPSLLQEKGGNVSVKSKSGVIITESGVSMANVSLTSNFCVCKDSSVVQSRSEEEYTQNLLQLSNSSNKSPSMETGIHLKNKAKCVIHVHPVHINALLCSQESKIVIDDLYSDVNYDYVEYTTPGYKLMQKYSGVKRVTFLESHGIVVAADDAESAHAFAESLDKRAKVWLEKRFDTLLNVVDEEQMVKPLFPDAAVFPEKMRSINSEISRIIMLAGLALRSLSEEQIIELTSMKLEKIRRGV